MINYSPLLEDNGKIKTIYINLEEEIDKSVRLEDKLKKLDFCNFRRFNAIKGSEVYNKLVKEDKVYKLNDKRGIYVNKRMVGVWQSHLHIWQEMIDKNIPVQLILEDDVNFHKNFNEKFYKVIDMIKDKDFDIFYIGYGGDSPNFNDETFITNTGAPRLAHSYILSINGAKKLVDKMSRLNWPIDEVMTGMYRNKKLIGYKTSELLVWQSFQWSRSLEIRNRFFRPKCAILITGQMRTYEQCFNSLQEHILSNNYEFHIFIFTEFYSKDINKFREKITNVYGNNLKKLYIESTSNKIDYPEHIIVNTDISKKNQYKCQYRNYYITELIKKDNINLSNFDLIIRMRPDIIFTQKINLDNYINKEDIFLVTRVNSGGNNIWIHNRDWDYCCLGNYNSINNWVQEWKVIKKLYDETKFNNRLFNNFEYKVEKKCNFNNQGYWEESTQIVNKAIGELYLNYLASVNQNVVFNLPCNTFAKIIRFKK